MKVIFKILFCLAFIGSFSNLNAQRQTGNFVFEGRTRNYEVYLPQNFQSNMPVVISLHGYTETIQWYKDYTLLHEFADTAGFITVYPAAIGQSWNSGLIAPGWPHIDTTVNDVGFISALIDILIEDYDIDITRVYCTGFSLGGEMTYRLAIELGYRFAAVASVAGLINDVSGNLGDPIRPFPILHIHGTEDNYETWWGSDNNLWTVPETIDFWLEKNGCSSPADSVPLPDIDPTDGCTVEKISYTNCSDEGCFIFYKIHNGGHSWPGLAGLRGFEGNKNMDINANVEIWNFFNNYQNHLLVNLAYAKSFEVYPNKYIPPQQGDTLKLSATISNPANHQVTVQALIQGENSSFKDSLQLFDDGLHNDSLASDNIFGEIIILDDFDEDYFVITLRTADLDDSVTTFYHKEHFTTIGPVEYAADSLAFWRYELDPTYNPRIYLTLRNAGSMATATGITARLSALDTCVTAISSNLAIFGDIPAGEGVMSSGPVSSGYYQVSFNQYCPIGTEVPFALSISSDGYEFWSDTLDIPITDLEVGIAQVDDALPTDYALHPAYPNPFNPVTTLRYDLPQRAEVRLTIYDILGRELRTLVAGTQEPGYRSVVWDGTDARGRPVGSGVYLYRIQAEGFTQARKMVLLK